jgi:DinB superfamily
MNKLNFLKNEFVNILATIDSNTQSLFGKMNVHQMIEHMGYAFRQASGLVPLEATGDEETTQKMYRFMMSDKPFKDNTPNPYLPDEPAPTSSETVIESLDFLQKDIDHFINLFEKDIDLKILNPFFGNLNFDEWTHLLHKHALHHLRQFGITPTE